MALAPVYVPVQSAPAPKFGLLETINPSAAVGNSGYGGVQFQSEFCGVARPFTSACEDAPDLGSIEVNVDNSSVATITSTGLPDGTYRIEWGDGDSTASEAEQLNETHDYTADGDGSYVVEVFKNDGGLYATTTITVEDGQVTGPFEADAVEQKVADDGITTVTGDPFTIYHIFQCRLIGNVNPEVVGPERALRSLNLGASRAVEEGFQTVFGTGATDISPGTPVDPVKSLGLLEKHAASVYGGRPVIHMDRQMATRLLAAMALVVVDGHLETLLGSLVIAGAGYDGNTALPATPTAGHDWMYATGEVRIWEGKAVVSPIIMQNPYDNEYQALAERVYIPTFECFNAAIKVTE